MSMSLGRELGRLSGYIVPSRGSTSRVKSVLKAVDICNLVAVIFGREVSRFARDRIPSVIVSSGREFRWLARDLTPRVAMS